MRGLILLSLASVALASEWTDLGRPNFRRNALPLLPPTPPSVMDAPPNVADPCTSIDCPRAPGQCYFDSVCSFGECLEFEARPRGAYCDDEDPMTMYDACDGSGNCIGAHVNCPADISVTSKSNAGYKSVFWLAPSANFGSTSFTTSSTHNPGDRFYEGTTEVVYTFEGNGPNGAVALECRFLVHVETECDDECCYRQDGTYGRAPGRQVDFVPELDRFESMFERDTTFTCFDGMSVCDQPRRFLPRRPLDAPPRTPKYFDNPSGEPITTRTPPTTRTTTRSTTTTTTTTTTSQGSGFCTFRQIDVLFVLDASGSVQQSNFDIAKDFVVSAVDLMDVGSNSVRVGGMMFHSEPLPRFDFDDYFDKEQVKNQINNFQYPTDRSYGTATGAALNYITDNLIQGSAGYRGGDAVVYFITDGVSQESSAFVASAAARLLGTGVEVVAVGITDSVDEAQLEVIAGSSDDVITVSDFNDLNDAVRDDLVSRACSSTTRTTTRPGSTDPIVITQLCEGRTTSLTFEACYCEPTIDDCHTCTYEDGVVESSCLVCKNGKYLLNGECVDRCPVGYAEEGRGSFFKTCRELQNIETCEGRTTTDTGSACFCSSEIDDCHTCQVSDGMVISGSCSLCKNAMFLLNGACLPSCPAGYSEAGRGNFGRFCERDATTPATTTTDDLPSVLCEGRQTNEATPASCFCGGDCHTCGYEGGVPGVCTLCKNAQFLHEGECISSCPSGTVAAGQGNFGRRCEPVTIDVCEGLQLQGSGASCRCDGDCHTCDWAGGPSTCSMCKNGKFLHNGECVDSCPVGTTPAGSGNFNKRCVAPAAFDQVCEGVAVQGTGASCRCNDDCHTCAWSETEGAGQCTLCKNAAFLHEGQCLETCPSGFEGAGRGNFGLFCQSNRRRSILSVESLTVQGTLLEPSMTAGIVAGVVGVVLIVVFAVVVTMRKRRTRADLLPTTSPTSKEAPLPMPELVLEE